MPKIQLHPKLERLRTTKKRFKVAIGGRSSGKSTGFGNIFTMKVQVERADLLCLREFQSSIQQSVHKLLKKTIERSGAQGFRVLDNKIATDTNEIIFNGMARNSSGIKSAEDFKYSWVEEAQTCSQDSLDDLLPTIRIKDSELWFSANPQSSEDPFSQRFIVPFKEALDRDGFYEDDLHLIVIVNWKDNPWHTEELEQQRLFDFKTMSRAKYDHVWEGAFNDTIENSIIEAEWFDAAIDSHKKLGFKPKGVKVASHDPSDGGDEQGYALRHGSVVLDLQEALHDVNDGFDWATDLAIQASADHFIWDGDGLGLSLKRQAAETFNGKHCKYQLFHGGGGVDSPELVYQNEDFQGLGTRKNKHAFRNKRAQYYWMLRDRFYNTYRAVEHGEYKDPDTLISLSSDIDCLQKLRSEICRIPRKPNGNGLIQIMSKDEMKSKYKIKSPNLADSLMQAFVDGLTVADSWGKPLNYKKQHRI